MGSNCGFFIIGDSYCVSAPSSTTTTTSTSTSSTAVTAPTQPGIVSSCTEYYITQSGDGCDTIESKFSISFAQFYAWNPAVGSNCVSLWLDETYCVAAPSQPGISTACTQYYVTKSGDGCDTIESAFGITFAQFYEWILLLEVIVKVCGLMKRIVLLRRLRRLRRALRPLDRRKWGLLGLVMLIQCLLQVCG